MELIVNNTSTPPKNLHPIWQHHFGFPSSSPKLVATPVNAGNALIRAVQALVAAHRPTTR